MSVKIYNYTRPGRDIQVREKLSPEIFSFNFGLLKLLPMLLKHKVILNVKLVHFELLQCFHVL